MRVRMTRTGYGGYARVTPLRTRSFRRRRWPITAGAFLALTAAACGAEDSDPVASAGQAPTVTSSAPAPTTSTATTPAVESATTNAGEPAAAVPGVLQFTAPFVGGGSFDGAAFAGRTVALLVLGAHLKHMQPRSPLGRGGKQEAARHRRLRRRRVDRRRSIDKHSLSFPQISDDPGDVFARFDVPSQPALVVVDPSGEIQQVLGAVESELLDSMLADATS